MCGICGELRLDGSSPDLELVRTMASRLAHRGPDEEGFFADGAIALGHRRLSIIDLTGGRQPMPNERRDVWVAFNGEVYNFAELRAELEAKGHRFRTRSDTEVIVHAYEEHGLGVLERLRGMFALAIWDARRRRLLLARDRLGKKPLYWSHRGGRLLFASELPALLAAPLERAVDPEALDCYLTFGYVPSPRTIYRTVRKLPPAGWLVASPEGLREGTYWDVTFPRRPEPIDERRAAARLGELLSEAVRQRLVSDVPLGAFLSGGIDSSAVVAHMAAATSRPVTVSIGFRERAYSELEAARLVAERVRADHHEFVVVPRAAEVLPEIVRRLGEPFADSSALPTWYVSREARRRVTVALSGDGGDESFAGYFWRYWLTVLEERLRGLLPPPLRWALAALAPLAPGWPFLPRVLRLRGVLADLARPLEERYFRGMSLFGPELRRELYRPELRRELWGFDPREVFLRHLERTRGCPPLSRLQHLDLKTYLPEDVLTKVDRMSMAHALEVRCPLLDHRLVEFAASLPPELKLRGRTTKHVLKRSLEGMVPAAILRRPKRGFVIPLSEWLRGELRGVVEGLLFAPGARVGAWVDLARLHRLWRRHLRGLEDHGHRIWALLMLELWCRLVHEGS